MEMIDNTLHVYTIADNFAGTIHESYGIAFMNRDIASPYKSKTTAKQAMERIAENRGL